MSKVTVPLEGYHIQIRDLSDSSSKSKDNREPIQQNMLLIDLRPTYVTFFQPVNFNFLFRYAAEASSDGDHSKQALKMVLHTLEMMSWGGIFDHVSKGFARYSTDERWHVPHFEKMLYDQGQLCVAYAQAYQVCNTSRKNY